MVGDKPDKSAKKGTLSKKIPVPPYIRQANLALLLMKEQERGLTWSEIVEELKDCYYSPYEKAILDSPSSKKDEDRVRSSKRKMCYRDRECLKGMGIKIEETGDPKNDDTRYSNKEEGFFLREEELNPFRLAQLRLALASMKELGGELFSDQLRSIRLKWGLEAPDRELDSFFLNMPSAESPKLLDKFYQSVVERKPVSFSYKGAKDKSYRRRRVQPVAMIYRWGGWHLLGYDLEVEDYRLFRVSSVKQSRGDL